MSDTQAADKRDIIKISFIAREPQGIILHNMLKSWAAVMAHILLSTSLMQPH